MDCKNCLCSQRHLLINLPGGEALVVLDDDLAVVVVQELRDGGVGKGGDEGAQRLEGRHPHPPVDVHVTTA